jgi:hypothetical protein
MKTKLILTLSKAIDDNIFTSLWTNKYTSIGTISITNNDLIKTIIIDVADQPTTDDALSINNYTTELVMSNSGMILSIQTERISDE